MNMWVCSHARGMERKQLERKEEWWMDGKRKVGGDVETLHRCRLSVTREWCKYVSSGHWPRLETLAAIICCDRSWFLWLTALAAELLCHANEQMRRWARLTADQRAALVTSSTHTRTHKLTNRGLDGLHQPASGLRCHKCALHTKHTDISIPVCFQVSVTEVTAHGQTEKKTKHDQSPHKHSRVGITLLLHCVPLHQRAPQICSRQQARGGRMASEFVSVWKIGNKTGKCFTYKTLLLLCKQY